MAGNLFTKGRVSNFDLNLGLSMFTRGRIAFSGGELIVIGGNILARVAQDEHLSENVEAKRILAHGFDTATGKWLPLKVSSDGTAEVS